MVNKKYARGLALGMCAVSLMLSGCGKDVVSTETDTDYLKTASYPLATDQTLKWWGCWGGNASAGQYVDPRELPGLKEYEKKVGVDIEWSFAAPGQEISQFNLLVASGDLPDIMSYYFPTDYPGGGEKGISDGVLLDMTELIPEFAPGFNKYLTENPNAAKELRTDSGYYYYFPSYVTTEEEGGRVLSGFVFRKDWLDKLGLPLPETISEWYTALKGFKEELGAAIPFSMSYTNFHRGLYGGWGFTFGAYKDGDTVKLGCIEPAYYEFLKELNKWYKEGLLDKNFTTIDSKGLDANVTNGKTGAAYGWITSHIEKWTEAARTKDPDFEMVGVRYPVVNKGEKPKFGTKDPTVYFAGAAINASSRNKVLALKVLDYGFTDEGREFLQYGVEGKTFDIVDGVYQKTALLTNNPEGLTESEASMVHLSFVNNNIPRISSQEGLRAKVPVTFKYPESIRTIETWTYNDANATRLPTTISPKEDVASEYAKLKTDCMSYAEEMMLKFIIGEAPLSGFDAYIQEMKKRGADRYVEMTQEMYNNFLKN